MLMGSLSVGRQKNVSWKWPRKYRYGFGLWIVDICSTKEKVAEMSNVKHLVIACGGTGGHFYPTLAIAKAFCGMGNEVTMLVAGSHASEQLAIAADNGLKAIEVPAVRAPQGIGGALLFPFRMLNCIMKARKQLQMLSPDVMLGMGSYASLPACIAAPKSLPLVLHEGNAFMGKTNRWMAGKAVAIGLSLPLAYEKQLKGTRSLFAGMPLRESLVKAAVNPQKDNEYVKSLGLNPELPTVLVFGGSQGARRINELFSEMAPLMTNYAGKIQFIHLTGTDDNDALKDAYATAGVSASIRRAESAIEKCYMASDLVVCRGGASSLCELALFGKPAIIIPLPSAADDHQSFNARLAEGKGGAIHLPQSKASASVMAEYIRQFMDNPEHFREMGDKLKVLSRSNAAEAMAALLVECAR